LRLRYQSTQEILADLDDWQGKRPIAASVVAPAPVPPRSVPWKWIAAGTLAAALGIAGWALGGKLVSKTATTKAAAGPEVSLAILPFRNGSGDAKLDWLGSSLAEMLSEKDIPGGVDRLADSIRQNLGMSRDVIAELRASSFQPTSKSLPALRDYNRGVQLMRDGKNLEAQKVLEAATKEDSTFAVA